jgi:hypothetical protein
MFSHEDLNLGLDSCSLTITVSDLSQPLVCCELHESSQAALAPMFKYVWSKEKAAVSDVYRRVRAR